MTTETMKTQTIAGHAITLQSGVNYLASRPMATRHHRTEKYPITIHNSENAIAHVIPGLTYDQANEFLTAFNNGEMSFDGRNW